MTHSYPLHRATAALCAALVVSSMASLSEAQPAAVPSSVSQEMAVDDRGSFEANAHIGLAVDTFAAGEVRRYLNPNESSGPQERMVGGFDFAYRLVGSPTTSTTSRVARANLLWVYGETDHGVRSTDIDCEKNKAFLICQQALGSVPARPIDQVLFTIRKASTLEAFTGFRYEFLTLQANSLHPANLYVKLQAGFISVATSPEDVADAHHVALGAIATKGPFEGSYLEVGRGRTDLFARNAGRRFKIDGYLNWKLADKGVSVFTQLVADVDAGSGSDAIQSYLGFSFDLDQLGSTWFGREDESDPDEK